MKPMTQAITVRNYQDIDRASCRSLWRELVEWHREIYQDSTIGGENPEECFDRHLSKIGPARIWVAVSESKVVGLIGLEVDGDEAEIEPVIVGKPYRGRGIGKQLVETAICEAQKIGTKYLNVAPVARNAQAVSFFHEQGFRNLGRVNLFMDLSNRRWKSSVEIHGCRFNF